jgi:hypothetical protein
MTDNRQSNLGDKLGIVQYLVTQYSTTMLPETLVIHVAVSALITDSMLFGDMFTCGCVGIVAHSHLAIIKLHNHKGQHLGFE